LPTILYLTACLEETVVAMVVEGMLGARLAQVGAPRGFLVAALPVVQSKLLRFRAAMGETTGAAPLMEAQKAVQWLATTG
jgi:hypothetical protein